MNQHRDLVKSEVARRIADYARELYDVSDVPVAHAEGHPGTPGYMGDSALSEAEQVLVDALRLIVHTLVRTRSRDAAAEMASYTGMFRDLANSELNRDYYEKAYSGRFDE